MSIRNLQPFFTPRSVAVIGASLRERAVGHVVLKNLVEGGFEGRVWPVNPKGGAMLGLPAFASVADLPAAPDLAVICTPAATVPDLVADLGARGTKAVVVISAGFGETGEEGRRLQSRMLEAARPHLLRIIGPNCVGVLAPGARLNASFAHRQPLAGDVAFVSQSGAVITTVLDWASARGIGFSHMVSTGGMADVDFGDLVDFLANDPGTASILLYVEQITHAAKFMSAARAAARVKPVIVIKPGRHEAAAKAAYSHTGALAGSDAAYDAAFRRAGMLRVMNLADLFDAMETLARPWRHRGDRLAILTNGGGVGVLAVDALLDEGGVLAELAPETIRALDAVLPETWSRANPVDIIGDAPGERYAAALKALDADPGVDAILAMNCPTAIADGVEAARAVLEARPQKPLLTCWLGEGAAAQARKLFEAAGAPTYETPGQAVRAFAVIAAHRRAQAMLLHAPPPSGLVTGAARAAAQALVAKAMAAGRDALTEAESKQLLEHYGVPAVPTRFAADADEAVRTAAELGFPAALKIVSPDVPHKSDAGGVALNLKDGAAVRAAAGTMLKAVAKAVPGARLEGFSVQRMAAMPGAHELIAGVADDVTFGPVVLFGQGGTAVEVIADKAVALPPLNRVLTDDLMRRTRVFRLLQGYRDRLRADLDAIAHVLMRLGEMAADIPELAELDINPLWASAGGVLALDARVRLAPPARRDRLAIRAYPHELETALSGAGGETWPVRPVKPEDAELLAAFIAGCAPEGIRMRFLGGLRARPASLAARLAQIDYRREMAFLAFEPGDGGALAAVARLAADPDNERAEFAILTRGGLEAGGLEAALMRLVMEYARKQGIGAVFGEVSDKDEGMIALCMKLGFARRPGPAAPGVTLVEAALG
ncbi:MAG: acetate--CoA ligase family protein [Maricaulaceae bacterium]|nr:acetate--CoA ligase family protein [Maricaulaceae bacterium]